MNNPFNELYHIMARAGAKDPPPGFLVGVVDSTNPLKIGIGDIQVYPLYISAGLALEAGDRVLVLASGDMQRFVVVSKILEVV